MFQCWWIFLLVHDLVFPENWFSVNVKEPVAYVIVEVVEGADMKPSDLNGSSNILPLIV